MQAWWPIFAPVAALAVNVLVQIVVLRAQRGRHLLRSAAIGLAAGMAALAAAQWFFPPGANRYDAWCNAVLVNLPAYVALSYCYFNFANLGHSSIRIRLYAEIAAEASGVTISDITREYNETALAQMRLQRLVESGDLVLRGGRYQLGRRRFVPIASAIFASKRFLLGKQSEFE